MADRYKDVSSLHSASLDVKPAAATATDASATNSKKKRPFPAGEPKPALDKGQASKLFSKVAQLVGFLKEHGELIRLDDLAIRADCEELMYNSELLQLFKDHDRTSYDPKTNLYRYKPDYDIHSKDDLLRILKNYLPRGGLPIKTLKDSWPQAQTAIDELERQGKILVTRSTGNAEAGKEGVPRMAFYNEMGKIGVIDEEFKKAWHELKTPDENDLPRELEAAGLRTTASAKVAVVTAATGKKKKKPVNRRMKITNTHIAGIDLSKDYVPPPKAP